MARKSHSTDARWFSSHHASCWLRGRNVIAGIAAKASAVESDPYVAAANQAGVPLEVLVAVAGAESGYHPWALDIEGRQVFCKSRAEAEDVLANTATTNVDIGVMQINWRFWGPRLGVAKNDLLDPRINLLMGAQHPARQPQPRRLDVAAHQQLSFRCDARARSIQPASLRSLHALPARRGPLR